MRYNQNKLIRFLSASDRINYGDLLFPIICEKTYKNKTVLFENYGIVRSDLSHFGALPGESYKTLQNKTSKIKGNIIVGGGEVLFADWQVLLSYLHPTYNRLLKFRNFRRLKKWLSLDKILFNKTENQFPFIIERSWETNVCYNAVGGVFPEDLKDSIKSKAIKSLKSAKVLIVRDSRTLSSLKKEGIWAKLAPDSAIILSDLFSKKCLKQKMNSNLEVFNSKPYIFIQLGKNCAPDDLYGFVQDLETLGRQLNKELLLCPIGLASGHEDHVILKRLCTFSDNLKYYHPNSIYDIMSLIAFSSIYIGTSLHGLITAQSFNVPFIPLNKKLRKVEGYCETWTYNHIRSPLNFSDLHMVPDIIKNWNFTLAESELQKQKKLVYQNFEEIWSNLE